MKIIYFITKSNFGGAQRYVLDMAKMAKNKGYLPAVAGGSDSGSAGGQKGKLSDKLEKENIPFWLLPSLSRDVSLKNDFLSFLEIISILRKKKPEIAHFNSSKMGLGILAARILQLVSGRPNEIIFTAHGWPFNEDRPYWQKMLIKFSSWLSVFFSTKTVTVAKFDFDKAKNFPLIKDRLFYVPNGISKINFLKKDEARKYISDKSGVLLENQFLIGTVAELNKNKGLSYLVEAAAALQKEFVKFVVIGSGDDYENLKEEILERELQDKVILLGRVDDAETYLKAFDAFLLPSVKEGLPYVLLEAGMASLPVIATSVGGIPEIIDDMESGILVRRKDPAEIITAINYLLDNPDQIKNFGKNLKKKVENTFSLKNMSDQTFGLYKF